MDTQATVGSRRRSQLDMYGIPTAVLSAGWIIGSTLTRRCPRSMNGGGENGSRERRSRTPAPAVHLRVEHAGVCVEELELAVGNRMADDEGALAYPPKSFSALEIGQLAPFGHRQAEDLRGVRGLG